MSVPFPLDEDAIKAHEAHKLLLEFLLSHEKTIEPSIWIVPMLSIVAGMFREAETSPLDFKEAMKEFVEVYITDTEEELNASQNQSPEKSVED